MTFSCSKKEETPTKETVSPNKLLHLGAFIVYKVLLSYMTVLDLSFGKN